MNKDILLIEPDYKCKYPPLGLMKIASYHKKLGDKVTFYKGLSKEKKQNIWDRIYISTLFSYFWSKTIDTINYYKFSVKEISNVYVGGVMATTMSKDIYEATNIKTIKGLLDRPGILDDNDIIVDSLTPDYSILDEINYKYPIRDAYFTYMTRGCCNKCKFCAVPIIEPVFTHYIPIKEQISEIDINYGRKKDLYLMDNNVLASNSFDKIIDDIKDIGFYKGAKIRHEKNGRAFTKNRYVDFNQGVDVRLLDDHKMKRLSELNIKPLRIAFDDIYLSEIYKKKVHLAVKYGIKYLSNYILYNYKDTPLDLYKRLKVNIDLNEKYGIKIYSYPMQYVPINSKDRKYVSPNWNRKFIRAIRAILNVTHGVVSPKKSFFNKAFGRSEDEFMKIMLLPEDYIIYRKYSEEKGFINKWNRDLKRFKEKGMFDELFKKIGDNNFKEYKSIYRLKINANVFDFICEHYNKRIKLSDYKNWKTKG